MAHTVFYSFDYETDFERVELIRSIHTVQPQPLLNARAWERLRQQGLDAVRGWVDEGIAKSKAVVVLIGTRTATRDWVRYGIEKAWQDRKPLLGIYIHGLAAGGSIGSAGPSPFEAVDRVTGVPIFNPTVRDWRGHVDPEATFDALARNLELWVSQGTIRPT